MSIPILTSIRGRLIILVALFGVCLAGLSVFAISRLGFIDTNFTEYHSAAVASEMQILMISRDMNYVSRLTRSIMLGDDYSKNMQKLDENIANIYKSYESVKTTAGRMRDQAKAQALAKALETSLQDTRAFLEDGRARMLALEKVDRSPEILQQTWKGYHQAATPLANTARDTFKVVTDLVQNIMNSNHTETSGGIGASQKILITMTVAVFVLALLLAFWITRSILGPIDRLHGAIAGIEQDSDLRRRVELDSQDELGATAAAVDKMLEKFHSIIKQVMSATQEVNRSTDSVTSITTETANGVRQQQSEIEQVATAMNEMSATVQEVAKNALSAAEAANNADHETQQGQSVVNSTIASINDLAQEVERTTEVINKLGQDSESIGKVLDVIRGIAEQTNLLALNAAIEAARAGEQGRGFAVVADEVRTLASRTQNSTKEIQDMITRLQQGAREAVAVMESGRGRARESVERAGAAGKSLQIIAKSVAAITEMNAQIASAAEEQSTVSEDINHKVNRINDIAEQSVSATQKVAAATRQLGQLSESLQSMVQQFRA
ncbi:MAG: methyl-accepting chemotaxis protein [Gammaproteobacteria bacterium]|nr:methyl-accepting chemotaxis protein [Gammaproteobacteria bacterium]